MPSLLCTCVDTGVALIYIVERSFSSLLCSCVVADAPARKNAGIPPEFALLLAASVESGAALVASPLEADEIPLWPEVCTDDAELACADPADFTCDEVDVRVGIDISDEASAEVDVDAEEEI